MERTEFYDLNELIESLIIPNDEIWNRIVRRYFPEKRKGKFAKLCWDSICKKKRKISHLKFQNSIEFQIDDHLRFLRILIENSSKFQKSANEIENFSEFQKSANEIDWLKISAQFFGTLTPKRLKSEFGEIVKRYDLTNFQPNSDFLTYLIEIRQKLSEIRNSLFKPD